MKKNTYNEFIESLFNEFNDYNYNGTKLSEYLIQQYNIDNGYNMIIISSILKTLVIDSKINNNKIKELLEKIELQYSLSLDDISDTDDENNKIISLIDSCFLESLWDYTELPENKEFKEKIRSFMGPKTREFFDHPF